MMSRPRYIFIFNTDFCTKLFRELALESINIGVGFHLKVRISGLTVLSQASVCLTDNFASVTFAAANLLATFSAKKDFCMACVYLSRF